jgi:ribulose-phosphate 3-epimerase
VKEKIIISPSMLSADFLRMGEQLASLENGNADWIHLDVMDGHFVPNLSFGPVIVETCRKATKLPLDVHLMISNPDEFLDAYAKSGADIITVHVETCPHLVRSLQKIKDLGCKAGVALNPGTSLHALDWVLETVDMVLLLGTNPGFSGQKIPALHYQ